MPKINYSSDWGYIFVKLCDMSFKGPRELRIKIKEAKKASNGELHSYIERKDVPRLENLLGVNLRGHIRSEKSADMHQFYLHHFNHLIWQLKKTNRVNQFSGGQLEEYLDYVKKSSGDGYYFPEPLLCLMALTMYILEVKKPE